MSYLEQVKKPAPQAPVITIVGFPGVGKSSLGALFPAPIFIQAENASSVFENWEPELQPAMLPLLPRPDKERAIKTSKIVLDQLRELITTQHQYRTVVFDSITSLNTMLESEVAMFDGVSNIGDAAGGYSKGYLVVASLHAEIRTACEYLRRRGMAVVFLAHSGIVKMKNRPDSGEYTAFTIDMPEKSRQHYIAHSDAVLYLKSGEFVTGTETNKKGQITKYGRITTTGDRLLITASDGTVGYVDAKNRYGMPHEMACKLGENPVLEYIKFFNDNSEGA